MQFVTEKRQQSPVGPTWMMLGQSTGIAAALRWPNDPLASRQTLPAIGELATANTATHSFVILDDLQLIGKEE